MSAGIWQRLAPVFAPLLEKRCLSCMAPIPYSSSRISGPALCEVCSSALARWSGGYCSRCGDLAASSDGPVFKCGTCLDRERPWDGFYFHGAYHGLLRELILRFKNGHELPLGSLLGGLLAAHPGIIGPYDVVIPVPLHELRMRERGFNQALELARPLAARLGVPLAPSLLRRVAHVHHQAGLSLEMRRKNVSGLLVAKDVASLRVLVLDDIATSCATVEIAAEALKSAGATTVDIAVLARTPL